MIFNNVELVSNFTLGDSNEPYIIIGTSNLFVSLSKLLEYLGVNLNSRLLLYKSITPEPLEFTTSDIILKSLLVAIAFLILKLEDIFSFDLQ